MVATREKWETESSLPRGASYEQMLEFFGIPPSTAEALDDNIGKKRRRWNHMSNSGNPVGRKKAAEVLAADPAHLAGGQARHAATSRAAAPRPRSRPRSSRRSRNCGASFRSTSSPTSTTTRSGWPARRSAAGVTPMPHRALAWVVANLVNDAGFAHPQLVAEGLEAAQFAVREQPGEVRNWESTASLLLASSRVQDAVAAVDQAERATGGRATAMLYLLRTRAMVDAEAARRGDGGRRARGHQGRARRGRSHPLRGDGTPGSLGRDHAADQVRCRSHPVHRNGRRRRLVLLRGPEAEDRVRAYRMWAINAGKRVFVGSDRMRSFLAVITGFISLPIHNYLRSQQPGRSSTRGRARRSPRPSSSWRPRPTCRRSTTSTWACPLPRATTNSPGPGRGAVPALDNSKKRVGAETGAKIVDRWPHPGVASGPLSPSFRLEPRKPALIIG